jgi:glycosyltransferase involved in cell wall biosynthesis
MIVKNEAHVVSQALGGVTPYIDCWVVVDTGSTDNTVDVVKGYFRTAGVPGRMYKRRCV